ncbi:Group II intron-encoded protein LtrA (plasmid) [Burkholderia sp. AD24]|nr:Group II intron-encoded protein LtrA [Burkholderia sp. AD24]
MTAIGGAAHAEVIDAGASSRPAEMWLQADWPRITDEVKRLQARIAQATKEGRWGKVSALQRLLTRSHGGKMLAVKRVTENRGKRTPGVDGKTWPTPAAKWKGVEAMQHRSYRALPLRRIYIPKSNGKKRPLGIPRMLCRSMQALWKLALEPIAESLADPNSYGFRPKRSTADAVEYCFTTLAKRKSPEWVLEGDIRGCFDNFSHDWILKHIPMDKVVLRRWLKAGFIDKGTLFATEAGTPQGGIISPVIANMTLDGLKVAVDASVGPTPRARRKFKVNTSLIQGVPVKRCSRISGLVAASFLQQAPMKSADLRLIASTSFELRKLLRFGKSPSYLICHHTQNACATFDDLSCKSRFFTLHLPAVMSPWR